MEWMVNALIRLEPEPESWPSLEPVRIRGAVFPAFKQKPPGPPQISPLIASARIIEGSISDRLFDKILIEIEIENEDGFNSNS